MRTEGSQLNAIALHLELRATLRLDASGQGKLPSVSVVKYNTHNTHT